MSRPEEDFRHAIAAAGLQPPNEVIADGRIHRFSSSGRRGDDAGWYVLHLDDSPAGRFGCWRNGLDQVWCVKRKHEKVTTAEHAAMAQRIQTMKRQREADERQRQAANAVRNAKVWSQCVPLSPGDPVTRYLDRRGLDGPAPSCLRLHPSMSYWDDDNMKLGEHPAMVAPLTLNGALLALHRTYLTLDGRKADVPKVKKVTPAGGRLAGACIPLAVPDHGLLGAAEGIENALAAQYASGVPTIATSCANMLQDWKWPADVQRLVIFGDNDKAGCEAVEILRVRALASRLKVLVLLPSTEGVDWAEVWAAHWGVAA